MKRVVVVHEDGRVLRTYDIDLGVLDREPQDHWYFMQARENAIADKLVARSEANQISCRFVDDLGEEKASEHPAARVSFPTREGADPAVAKRVTPTAKIMAWVAAITVAIGAFIAISIKLLLSVAGIPRDIP
jgi:hypothetical protein